MYFGKRESNSQVGKKFAWLFISMLNWQQFHISKFVYHLHLNELKKKKKFKLQIMVGGGQIGRYCHIVKLLCIFIIIIVLLYKINANRKKKKKHIFFCFLEYIFLIIDLAYYDLYKNKSSSLQTYVKVMLIAITT